MIKPKAMVQRSQATCLPISFTHVLNPFVAKAGSEHDVASRLTWRTLSQAAAQAQAQGMKIDVTAVILAGDASSVRAPVTRVVTLSRTVADVATLKPQRLLPLIGDLLTLGAAGSSASHIIFSNMDIAVQPHFYIRLQELVKTRHGSQQPFAVPRVNIDAALADAPLAEIFAATGPLGQGYDCFVIPRPMITQLDLGLCCIGSAYFDYLLAIELDALSQGCFKNLIDERLTVHLGSDIAWASMMDYLEHNLSESLLAIERFRRVHDIQPGGFFDRLDMGIFQRGNNLSNRLLRNVRRLPGLSSLIIRAKRAIGRQY